VSTAPLLAQKTCPRCGALFDEDAVFCAKDGARLEPENDLPPDSDLYIGTVIADDIEIRSVAGAGAMGRVYRAHQRGIDRDVAVKILHRELSGNTQLVARFHREAKIASKLQHPHVVEVYLAGQLPDKALYIVMEYLDGMSLAAALTAADGVFAPARALSIALQICDAVGEGHARGIVHRDLKPENVMLVRRADMGDWAKVLDFGIAKVNLGEQSMETAAGLIFGTARYISPEGAQGATVGPPGDVYSLATMVYQMLAGRTPFDAEPVGLLIKHIHEAPPPITSWPRAANLHPALAKVVMDNLAKDPKARAPGARVFATQLAAAAKEANISISEVSVVARFSNVPSPALDPTIDDASAMLAGVRFPSGSPAASAPTPAPAPTPPIVSTTAILPSAPPRPSADVVAPPQPPRGSSLVVIVLACLLAAALAVLGTLYLTHRVGDDRTAHVARARRALSDSRYVNPPGENVRDLVASGLVKWPDDPELSDLRSAAAHEMLTRALAARAAGDLGGARDLVRDASQLDPTDGTAGMLKSQYQEEAEALVGAGRFIGPPKVLFEAPSLAKPGQRVELVARIAPGQAGATAKITATNMVLFENGKTVGGRTVPITSSDPLDVRGTLVIQKAGSYDIVFETAVDGVVLRAQRDLDVIR
jgi:serine/threonine-protein kinase